MHLPLLLVLLLLSLLTQTQAYLTEVNYPDLTAAQYLSPNFGGISLSFPQIYDSALTSTLFQGYIKNAWVYGSTVASWGISLKMQYPVGYKYDCPVGWTTLAPNATCILDVKPYYSSIGQFFRSTSNTYNGLSLGFDRADLDFRDPTVNFLIASLSASFYTTIGFIGSGIPGVEVFDQADTYNANGITPMNYTPAIFIQEFLTARLFFPSSISGPGLTEGASADWLDSYSSLPTLNKFTVYSVPFKTTPELTLANILDQANYLPYLMTRLTGSSRLNPSTGKIVITDIKMTEGNGLDGITNAMVSAIWALDFMLESARYGLKHVLFNTDISNSSMQSPFGPAPDYAPQPLYYALLMMSIIQQDVATSFLTPTVVAGSSLNIKVYGFIAGEITSTVLINKDTNSSASGTVFISSTATSDMTCIYMSASSLTSKAVTLGGLSFIGGTSSPQGNYTAITFVNLDGTGFRVSLSFAQAVYCRVLSPELSLPVVIQLSAFSLAFTLLAVVSLLFL